MTHRTSFRQRRGITFYELLASLTLLIGIIAGVGQCLVTVGRASRETARFERAVELANIALERAAASSAESLNTEVRYWNDQDIEGVDFEIQLQVTQQSPGDRVSATVTWQNLLGDSKQVTLHAWRRSDS